MKRQSITTPLSFLSVVIVICAFRNSCCAEFVFIGPSPYLSAADSPFPLISNPTFHLEDFESDPGCVPGPGSFCGGGKFDALASIWSMETLGAELQLTPTMA